MKAQGVDKFHKKCLINMRNFTQGKDHMRSTASALIFDNLLGLTAEQLRVQTALYAIVYDSLTVSDSWLLTNKSLQDMLLLPDGVELLRAGIIKPMLNEEVSLGQRHQQFLNNPALIHGFSENPALVKLIEEQVTDPLFYNGAQVGANYQRLWSLLMNEAMMSKLGMTEQAIRIVLETFAIGQAAGQITSTNTFVKDKVFPLVEVAVSGAQAELLMEIARAPYALNLPTLYNFGVVAPSSFRGHEILRKLNLQGRETGELAIGQQLSVGQFQVTIHNRLVSWLLSAPTLASLTPQELAAIRGSSKRPYFQQTLGHYLKTPSQSNWTLLSAGLESYLTDASQELFNSRRRRDEIKGDPTTADQVSVEGSTHQVKVDSGDGRPLSLSDLPSASSNEQDIQIVGRSNVLPTVPTT